jgi:hypothetical protein
MPVACSAPLIGSRGGCAAPTNHEAGESCGLRLLLPFVPLRLGGHITTFLSPLIFSTNVLLFLHRGPPECLMRNPSFHSPLDDSSACYPELIADLL